MKYLPLVMLVMLLSGCSIAHEAALPDGTRGYVISHCHDLSYCYNRAAELCHGKYEILNQGTDANGAFANGIGAIGSSQQITVHCGEPR